MKPRVVRPSSDVEPDSDLRPPKEPNSDRRSDVESEAGIGDRFSRAARYHSILLGRGAHRVRHGIRRIGKHRAVQGVAQAIGNRWWPNAGSANDVASTERRWKLPFRLSRREEANAEGAGVAVARPRHAPRLAWDFAVVTAAVAILVVLHHQFKRPHRSLVHRSIVAAAVEPNAEGSSAKPFKRHRDEDRDKSAKELVAAADRPADLPATSREIPRTDMTSVPPAQGEPAANSSDLNRGDANATVTKHDDVPASTPVNPAESTHGDPRPSPGLAGGQPQSREVSKPAVTADSTAPSLIDPPQNADSSTQPEKHRHRHHTPDTGAVASGDSSFPNLDAPPQATGSSTAPPTATASPEQSSGPKTAADSASAPGPSLGVSDDHSLPKQAAPTPSQAVPVVANDGAPGTGSQQPKAETDIFGGLQDSAAEKHDAKGPDLGAAPPAEKQMESAPHRRHHKPTPAQPESASPEPIRTADQSPPGDALVDSKPKALDPVKPVDPKPADKLDTPAPPHDHELKGPDPGFNVPADQPAAAPPRRRRHRPVPENATPDALRANDQIPIGGTPADSKPHEPDKAVPAPIPAGPTPVPAPEPKKADDWSVPSNPGPPAAKDPISEPKTDHSPDKPTPAAEHDLLGTLKDDLPEKHDAGVKGPDAGIGPPAGNSLPSGDEPPKPRRRRRPSEHQLPVPAPAPATEPGSTIDHAPAPKAAATPAPASSDAVKNEVKPADPPAKEPKAADTPVFGDRPPGANVPAAKPDQKPEPPVPPRVTPTNGPGIAGALHPAADESQQANVSFTRSLPEKANSGNLLIYKIVVRNNGTKLLKLVDIDEAVPADHTVHSTEPAAEVHDQTLHWSVRDLAPHEATTIAISLAAPPAPQPIVPAVARPKPEHPEEDQFKTSKADEASSLPHLELELIAPSALRTGESCRIGFKATNLGAKMSGLKLNLDLPAQIHFGKGQKLQYKVGELDGHESREDYLTAVAAGPGVVEIHGSILLDGRTLATAKATCRIEGAPSIKQAARPRRDGFVVPASASHVAPATPAPCNCSP